MRKIKKAKISPRHKKKDNLFKDKKLLITIGLFSIIVISLNLGVWWLGKNDYLSVIEVFTAKVAVFIINLSGIKTGIKGNIVTLPKETWIVNTECTALFVMIIFSSFIVVYQAKIKDKAIALLTGIPAIFVINILRLLILAWLTQFGLTYAKLFHDYIWQVAFILMIVFFWLIWIERIVSVERKTTFSG